MMAQIWGNFSGVGHAGLWNVWRVICPDPNPVLRVLQDRFRAL